LGRSSIYSNLRVWLIKSFEIQDVGMLFLIFFQKANLYAEAF
jgi:hypothetical protein